MEKREICPYAGACGGCDYQGVTYQEQLKKKQKQMKKLLGIFGKVQPILGEKNPYHYRNKVHHVVVSDKRKQLISGVYRKGTHKVVDIDHCMIEDEKCQTIIKTIEELARSFKIRAYNEDTGRGVLRHILLRRGFNTGEILVVLVVGNTIFPSKKEFVKELLLWHPEITSVVVNYNLKKTTFVLGEKEEILYGNGYITDILLEKRYRISPKSFYQINTAQTEVLYKTAIEMAGFKGNETVIDAYCGIGTIGLSLADSVKKVIGVELNQDAVRDAKENARNNGVTNVRFYQGDAGRFMVEMANAGKKADVVIMDPPRSGSDERFLQAIVKLRPEKVIYISCGPDTQKRDMLYLKNHGYQVKRIQPVDLFSFTRHVESAVLLTRSLD